MLIICQRKSQFEKEFTIENKTLDSLKGFKYLGVHRQLNFREHVNHMDKCLVKFCGFCCKIIKVLTTGKLIKFLNFLSDRFYNIMFF